ncbi:MAG: NUDIX domain-containing protein [Patescibacteria group bacterium]|nr:NUDIX domain-containing protein [Patescibacteria group bacterium]
MKIKKNKLFELVTTAIILEKPYKKGVDPKFLILQRAEHEKFGPLKWTVPGGKLATEDYTVLKKQTEDYWYGAIEAVLRREVAEECNLKIKNIWYLTSLARVTGDGFGNLVLSFVADNAGGELKIDEKDFNDYAWVTTEEAKKYDLFDGIVEEFVMIEKVLAGERDVEWQRLTE